MSPVPNEHHEVNRNRWNEVTPVHVASEFYGVDAFMEGRSTLGHVERRAVGDVSGRSLLHLQCHFGMDTLSWARLGARVVGLDISDAAIATARSLAEQASLGASARFVQADVTRAGTIEGGPFDIVFTSFGTIVWLQDLRGWARTIAANLAPEGVFHFLDSHPAAMMFDEETDIPTVRYDYFQGDTPVREPPGQPDYADRTYRSRSEARSFTWGIADIFSALETAGLTIFEVREYPFTAWRHFPGMERAEDGYWHAKGAFGGIPLLLGFKARW